jgi:phosphoglycolate phosphatase-like HAD superfamily hydrolase
VEPTHLVLFDIDGTLVLTGRAGLRAMNRACEEAVGHANALNGTRWPSGPTRSASTT